MIISTEIPNYSELKKIIESRHPVTCRLGHEIKPEEIKYRQGGIPLCPICGNYMNSE